MKSGKKKVMD